MPLSVERFIGESAVMPDFEKDQAKQESYLEAGKRKAAEAAQKQKDSANAKYYADIIKEQSGKHSHLIDSDVDKAAQSAAADVEDIYHSTRTPEDFYAQGAERVLKYQGDIKGLQSTAENYDKYAALDPSQLTYWGQVKKAAANTNNMNEAKEVMNQALPNPFGKDYDPKTGRVAPPTVVRNKEDVAKEFQQAAKTGIDGFYTKLPTVTIQGTTYDRFSNVLPETQQQAAEIAKKNNIPLNPNGTSPLQSVESIANTYMATHPSGVKNWLLSKFQTPDDVAENTDRYFTHDPDPSTGGRKINDSAVNEDYKQYVYNNIRQSQQPKEKDLSGRPVPENTFGSAGNVAKTLDELYKETNAASKSDLDAANKQQSDAKSALDEATKKATAKFKNNKTDIANAIKAEKSTYNSAIESANKRQKENDFLDKINAQAKSGKITPEQAYKYLTNYKSMSGLAVFYNGKWIKAKDQAQYDEYKNSGYETN